MIDDDLRTYVFQLSLSAEKHKLEYVLTDPLVERTIRTSYLLPLSDNDKTVHDPQDDYVTVTRNK